MLIKQVSLTRFIVFLILFVYHQKSTTALNYEASQRCFNPNGRMGRCISIYECQTIIAALRTRNENSANFVRASECSNGSGGHKPYVCCTTDTGFIDRAQLQGQRVVFPVDPGRQQSTEIKPVSVNTKRPFVAGDRVIASGAAANGNLFPQPPNCGRFTISNKIYGGEEAELGEFTWLANLEYRQVNGGLVSVCAGNIINQRYILTAAHCIKGEIEKKIGKLVSLRIGDHNTATSVDCNGLGCLDPPQTLGIESVTVHENYVQSDNRGIRNPNDIALIRTNRNMIFSESIQPICLPDFDVKPLRSGQRLTVVGWGHTGTARFSSEKRKVELPYVENNNCRIRVADEQLCAGGVFMKDSCSGDSGGPLMRLTSQGWIMEGIVSYGRGCGLEQPAVYTRVRSYMQWIRNNVKP